MEFMLTFLLIFIVLAEDIQRERVIADPNKHLVHG